MTAGEATKRPIEFCRRHAGDALFWVLFASLATLSVQPFWVVHWLPGTDTGGHLELMDIAGRLSDPDTAYGATYVLGGWLQPNTLGIALSRLLHPWVDTLTLGRLLLSFYVVGTPLGALALVRAYGPSRWLVLLTFPLAFNFSLSMGFFNYIIAIPFLLFSVAAARRFADVGGVRWGLALAALLAITFFTHAIVFLVAGGMATYVIALGRGGLRRRALGVIYILAGSSFCTVWVLRKFFGWGAASGPPMSHHASGPAVWASADKMVSQLPRMLLNFSHGHTDDLLFLGLVGVWIALATWSSRPAERAEDSWRERLSSLPVLAFGVTLAYVIVPSRLVGVALVSERFASLALLLWVLSLNVDVSKYLTRALILTGIVIGVVFASYATRTYRLFDDQTARPLARALADLPHGRRLSYAKTAEGPTALAENTTRHLPKAIWALQNGGITDDSFAYRPTSPIQYLPEQTPPRPNIRFWRSKTVYRGFDYILYRAARPPPPNALRGFVRLIWHDRWWWLYEVIGGPAHAPEEGDAAAAVHARSVTPATGRPTIGAVGVRTLLTRRVPRLTRTPARPTADAGR